MSGLRLADVFRVDRVERAQRRMDPCFLNDPPPINFNGNGLN